MYRNTRQELAVARLVGGPLAPNLHGEVLFETIPEGVIMTVYVVGLPTFQPKTNGKQVGPHGFHIHEHGSCEIGNPEAPFKSAGGHWNPTGEPHGNHAGDFPSLFSNQGLSYMVYFTNRFKVSDIIGKSLVIHESPDDYTSQPSGASGRRLACGLIERFEYDQEERY